MIRVSFPDRRDAVLGLFSAGLACKRKTSASTSGNHVRLAVTRGSLLFLPVYVAGPLGCFGDEGLSVEIDETASVSRSAQALLGGSADVASGGLTRPLLLALEGRRARAFMVLQKQPGFVAAISPKTSRSIQRIEDAKGAIVGTSTPGSDYHLIWNYALAQHGLSAQDYQMVGVGTAASAAVALERGKVDIGLIAGTTIPIVERHYPAIRYLFDTRTEEGTASLLGSREMPIVLYAQPNWLQENGAIAGRLVRSVKRAVKWIQSNGPEKVREKLPASLRTDSVSDFEALRFTAPMLSASGRISAESVLASWNIIANSNEEARRRRPVLEDAYTNEWTGSAPV